MVGLVPCKLQTAGVLNSSHAKQPEQVYVQGLT